MVRIHNLRNAIDHHQPAAPPVQPRISIPQLSPARSHPVEKPTVRPARPFLSNANSRASFSGILPRPHIEALLRIERARFPAAKGRTRPLNHCDGSCSLLSAAAGSPAGSPSGFSSASAGTLASVLLLSRHLPTQPGSAPRQQLPAPAAIPCRVKQSVSQRTFDRNHGHLFRRRIYPRSLKQIFRRRQLPRLCDFNHLGRNILR